MMKEKRRLIIALIFVFSVFIFTSMTFTSVKASAISGSYPYKTGDEALANGVKWIGPSEQTTTYWQFLRVSFDETTVDLTSATHIAIQIKADKGVPGMTYGLIENGDRFTTAATPDGTEEVFFVDESGNISSLGNVTYGATWIQEGEQGTLLLPMSAMDWQWNNNSSDLTQVSYFYLTTNSLYNYNWEMSIGSIGYYDGDPSSTGVYHSLLDVSTNAKSDKYYIDSSTMTALEVINQSYPFETNDYAFYGGVEWDNQLTSASSTATWQTLFMNFESTVDLSNATYIGIQYMAQKGSPGITFGLESGTTRYSTQIAGEPIYFMDEFGLLTKIDEVLYSAWNIPQGEKGMLIIPVSALTLQWGDSGNDLTTAKNILFTTNSVYNYNWTLDVGTVGYFDGEIGDEGTIFTPIELSGFYNSIPEDTVMTGLGTFEFSYTINHNGVTSSSVLGDVLYGETISIDAGTQSGYVFVGFIENGKVDASLETSTSFEVYDDMDLELFYKPDNAGYAVILMDTNQDLIDILYTDELGQVTIPDPTGYTKPGLVGTGWTDGTSSVNSSSVFTEDIIVYLEYGDSSEIHSVEVLYGTGPSTAYFNETITVTTENGDGSFKYWLKDGLIASVDTSYTFTVSGDHILEAVYTTTDVNVPSGTMISVSAPLVIETDYTTLLGQFNLADGETLVEYGIIHSDTTGEILLSTEGVSKINSHKFNPYTNEFVLTFSDLGASPLLSNYRAFITVKDSNGNLFTIYSQVYTKIWYHNSDNWTDVYIYAWESNGYAVFGDWSGAKMIQDGITDWYYYYLPSDVSSSSFLVQFNDGLDTYQTKTIEFNSLMNVYATAKGELYADKITAETGLETTRIWFYNEQNWTTVYYHIWYISGVEDVDIPVTDYDDPPTAIQDGSTQWYYIDLDVNTSVTELGIIFKDAQVGDGWRTDDISISTHTHVYVVSADVAEGNLDTYLSYHQPV